MAKNLSLTAAQSAADPARAMTPGAAGFLGSLGLLLLALVVFFLVMLSPHLDAPEIKTDVLASLAEARRLNLRVHLNPPDQPASLKVAKLGPLAPRAEQNKPAAALPTKPLGQEHALPIDPEVQRAISLIDAGNVSEAVGVLEAILKKDPRNESALVELAMVHLLDLKQPEQAMGYLQRVMDVNPQNQVVLTELVSLYEEQGRLEEGVGFLMDVAQRAPNSPDLAYGIGQMLSLQGRDAEAISYLEKATHSSDNQVRAFRDLAEAYSRSGDGDKAIDAYDKAILSQEKDIADKTAKGMPVTFAEERLNYTKMDKARELIRAGDFERAQALIEDVSRSMPGDESVLSLQQQIDKGRQRAG